MPDFKEQHREFQEIVRELELVRNHNKKFGEGDPQDSLLLIAEGALVLIGLERFLRMIVPDAGESDTLANLLEKATRKRDPLIKLNGDRDTVKNQLADVRNTLLHGNYEQAAMQAGCDDVSGYFKRVYASEVEALYKVLDSIVRQIDRRTGKPHGK